jgi:hypothetical protein
MAETREEIRARLLRDENIIQNIQFRAYEIWILRGRVDGRHHEDWALAENEIINFLIEQELKNTAEAISEVVEEIAAAENEGMNLVQAPEAEIAPEKKPRKRAATKATSTTAAKTTTAKKAATAKTKETAETGEKKTAVKMTATKRATTAKKASSKKPAKAEQSVVK